MNRDAKFWYTMVVFQLLFGLTVFALTREYYRPESGVVNSQSLSVQRPAADLSSVISTSEAARTGLQTTNDLVSGDPIEISRQAEEYFASKQYDKAATMYERLLAFSPGDGELHNNLGLTLHYMGRSTEALQRLQEGVAVEPENQRIWLTLGYVNSALGNTEEARRALLKATQTGSDEAIRQSATDMLQALPHGMPE